MTVRYSELARAATTNRDAEVTVESVDHQHVSEKRYVMHFNDFELARHWIQRMLLRYEFNDKRIRLIAWRGWAHGPEGREMLGTYESKHTC